MKTVLAVALTVMFVAADAPAPPSTAVAQLFTEIEATQNADPAAARRLVEQLLQRRDLTLSERARALSLRCGGSTEPAQGIAAAEAGLRAAREAKNDQYSADLLLCRGSWFEEAGEQEKALADFLASRAIAEKLGDRGAVAQTYAQSGYVFYYRGDFNAALVDLQKSYDLARQAGSEKHARSALAYIAHVYADPRVAQYDRAIEYYRQLLPGYEAAKSRTNVADTLFNIGSTYEQKGDFSSALLWFGKSLKAEQELGRAGDAAYVKRSIGMTLAKLDRASEALPLFDEALRYFVQNNVTDNEMLTRQSRGIALRKLGRLSEAIADLEASRRFFESTKNVRFLEKSVEELALAYAAAGKWQQAYEARSSELALQRQLSDKLREEHTSRLRVQFDAERKEQENRGLVRENALRARALDAASRVRRLQTIVMILAAAIIIALAYLVVRELRDARRMRVMAMTDELTRLPNRRNFLTDAETALARARDGGGPFSFIAFDIDHFKRINDTWGHAAGDLVLQRVAHACRAAIRPGDRIGRVGGEEFAVLLTSRLAEAEAVAERLRAAVEALDFSDIDPTLRVTISLGVTEWSAADTTIVRIAGRADEVLYRAKERGRNRVELAVA